MFLKILLGLLTVFGALLSALLLYALFLWICSLFVDRTKFYDEMSPFYCRLKDITDAMILFFLNVKVELEGAGKLPEDGLYLLVSNHRSMFDPLAVMRVLQKPSPVFVSKPENFNIPIGGRIGRRLCFRAIDRENARNAMATILDCVRLLKNGVGPIVIYPEGTRSKTGELLPFHDGVFKIAQHAKVPVAVMTVTGSESVKKNAPWKRTVIKLRICDVLPAEAITGVRTSAIGQQVREIMEESLRQS